MSRALVTGAAGFLGSHLCDRLIKDGWDVVAIDNLYTGASKNLAHLADDKRFKFIKHDVTKPFNPGYIERIYNLACPASPPHYQKDPLFTLDTNYLGVKNMLELAAKHGARILQASTSEVYGDPAVHPQKESYWGNVNSFGIRSCYDEGKRVAETLMLEHHRTRGVNIRVIRIFNTYGPRMDPNDGRVVSNFIVQALRNEPLTVYGSGKQTRSICFVDDLIEGMVRMMENPGFIGPVNLGNPTEMTVLDIAKKIKRILKCHAPIVCKPLPKDDPTKRKPDITLAKERLGWEPKITPTAGITATIEYFKTIV